MPKKPQHTQSKQLAIVQVGHITSVSSASRDHHHQSPGIKRLPLRLRSPQSPSHI